MVREAVQRHPRSEAGRQLKIYYATQADIRPPTFVFFVNDPKLVHFTYQRYLENQIRAAFGFQGTAIRLIFRGREEPAGLGARQANSGRVRYQTPSRSTSGAVEVLRQRSPATVVTSARTVTQAGARSRPVSRSASEGRPSTSVTISYRFRICQATRSRWASRWSGSMVASAASRSPASTARRYARAIPSGARWRVSRAGPTTETTAATASSRSARRTCAHSRSVSKL